MIVRCQPGLVCHAPTQGKDPGPRFIELRRIAAGSRYQEWGHGVCYGKSRSWHVLDAANRIDPRRAVLAAECNAFAAGSKPSNIDRRSPVPAVVFGVEKKVGRGKPS